MTDASAPPSKLALHWKILIGLGAGAAAGLLVNAIFPAEKLQTLTGWTNAVGQVFLRLILMVVIPLVFSALVLGVAGLGDVRKLGRMGLRTLVLTLVLSSLSVILGLGMANLVRPGARLSAESREKLLKQHESEKTKVLANAGKSKSLRDVLLDIIPRNPLQEMVGALDGSSPGGGMLAVMFFALMVGIAVSLVPQRMGPFLGVVEGIYDVSMFVIGLAMKFAPVGVAALVFSLTAILGLEILKILGWYVATVVVALAIHQFGVYSAAVRLLGGMSPRKFFAGSTEAMLTAFGTSSSSATLPTSLRVAEQKLGLRPEISRFVLTIGATANQNGTALYEGITVLFLAQVFAIPLSLTQQITVMLMAILAGIGTAGVPGGSLPLVVMVLITVGIPAEAIAVILGVDRLLDMCRTTVNVTGDLAVAACIQRAEESRTPPAPAATHP